MMSSINRLCHKLYDVLSSVQTGIHSPTKIGSVKLALGTPLTIIRHFNNNNKNSVNSQWNNIQLLTMFCLLFIFMQEFF